ncbi:CHAT domain-containing protein [Nonomuraea sp. NPDC050022]|uniref:CHAT domain-containing protein n=1 Tax=Nonomuraea sp. NPDC050022 TaxID=3364358 RepID=UPI0037978689
MAIPYVPGAFGDLVCPRCGELLPEAVYWMVLTPDSAPELLELVDEGRLNLVECAVCGDLGDLSAPVLWADDDRSILVYDTFTASREESAVRAEIFALLEERGGFDVGALRVNSLSVRNFRELNDFRELDDEWFALALEGIRLREARMGIFGQARVEAICRDIRTSPIFFISDYERSAELLGRAELWCGDEARSVREVLDGALDPDDETLSPGSKVKRLPPSALEWFHTALAEARQVITGEIDDIGELIGAERAVGVLLDRDISLTPVEAERFGEAAIGWDALLNGLPDLLEQLAGEPAEESPAAPENRGVRQVMRTLGGGEWQPFAWTDTDVIDPPDGLEEAVAAYEAGRYEEALERTLLVERSCRPDQRRLCALYTAMLTLECGRPYGRGMAWDAIEATITDIQRTGRVELNELTGLAHVQRVVGEVERSIGEFQWALNHQLSAFDLYLSLEDWGWLSEVGPALVVSLVAFGRQGEAFEIADLLDTEEIGHRMPRALLAEMFGALASAVNPGLEIVCDLGTGEIGAIDLGGAKSMAVVEFRSPNAPAEAGTLIVGNHCLNELVRALVDAEDPADRLRLLLAILQAEAGFLAGGRAPRETVNGSLIRSVHQLGVLALQAAGDDPPQSLVTDIALAFALACQVAVIEALRADEIFARGGPTGDLSVRLWGSALLTGKVAYALDRILDERRRNTMTAHGWLTEAVLTGYALALETAEELDQAIDLYQELIPRAEKRRSVFLNRMLTLWAQATMTPPYTRLSRCLFARYLSGGDFQDALLAGDALERHRARELRQRGIVLTGTEPTQWLVSPLTSAAATLPDGHAVICVGLHPHTVRVEGRWMAVGLPADPPASSGGSLTADEAGGWAEETIPPELLFEAHLWFSDRMQEAAQAVREARIATMEEYAGILERLVPAADVHERLATLWQALGAGAGRFGELHLSTEGYALQLPWSAAALLSAGEATVVRVVATTALVGRPQRPAEPTPAIVVAVQDDRSERANAQLLEAGGDLAELIYSEQPSDEADVGICLQADLHRVSSADALVLLGHGRRGRGLTHALHDFTTQPRTVVLLGCWSAHIDQDLSHMEVEGLAVSLLASGVEAVVASLWPVTLEAGALLTSRYLAELSRGVPPGRAFATARTVLRSDTRFDHPAVWCGFTLFG